MTLRIDDRELQRILRDVRSVRIKVGYPEETSGGEKPYYDENGEVVDLTLAENAMIHNFGMGVPERPFMSIAQDHFRENHSDSRRVAEVVQSYFEGGDPRELIDEIGVRAVGEIQLVFRSGLLKPNSEATIAAKDGRDTPLVDDGKLRQRADYVGDLD